jgi:hypothetical protein
VARGFEVSELSLVGVDKLGFSIQKMIDAFAQKQQSEIVKIFRRTLERWRTEAVKRAPVDMGILRNELLTEVWWEGETLFGALGSNLPYAEFIEFGNKWIAKGQVKRLGMNPNVTDSMAVHWWDAKAADATKGTSRHYKAAADGTRELLNRDGETLFQLKRGGRAVGETMPQSDLFHKHFLFKRTNVTSNVRAQEQMPFIRPAFQIVQPRMIEDIENAMKGDK